MRRHEGDVIRARIIKIGRSYGIRLPKAVLEQTGLQGEVEVVLRKDSLVIRPVRNVRKGWDASFAEMAERGDDRMDAGEVSADHSFDEREWEWDSSGL